MNSVILIGSLTKDIELRYTTGQNQMAVAKFNLAVPRMKKDEVDFPQVTVFGKQAENLAQYCKRGSKICVQGRIQTGSYEKDGKKVYTTDVIADRLEFLTFANKDKKEQAEEQVAMEDFDTISGDVPF